MDLAGIINGHMQLYPHFVKNISQFPIGVFGFLICRSDFKPARRTNAINFGHCGRLP